jgi:SagB-type dehydrogenase family enzyme
MTIDFSQTDQNRGVPAPAVEKAWDPQKKRITLTAIPDLLERFPIDLTQAILHRISHRTFQDVPLTKDELSFLLWATQGVRQRRADHAVLRTVPSAGCRHTFETYVVVFAAVDIPPGVYRYLPLEHNLVLEFAEENLHQAIADACLHQVFVGESAVVFVWTTIPYRMEWRYSIAAHRAILLDAGHVCQNLYLACQAIQAGTRAIAAYDQQKMDTLLRADGADEFTVYCAPVGKVQQ